MKSAILTLTMTFLICGSTTSTVLAELKITVGRSAAASKSKDLTKSTTESKSADEPEADSASRRGTKSESDKSTQADKGQPESNKTKEDEPEEPDEAPEHAINRYGEGDTLSSSEEYRGRHGVVDGTVQGRLATTSIKGETRTHESRSRTYEERSALGYKVGAQRQDNLVRSEYHTETESKALKLGDVEVAKLRNESSIEGFVGAQADAEAGFELGTDPRAEAKAGVFVGARVDAESTTEVDILGAKATTTAEGSASVGAEASVGTSLSEEGAEVEASAFAGARAEGSVSGEVGGVEGKATGEAWAGVGAEAKGTATFEDGKLTLGTEAGAALGVGGKVGYEATVDVGKVHDSGKALVKSTGKFVDNAAPKVQNTLVLQQPRLSSKGTRLVVNTPRLNLPEGENGLP